MEMMGAMFARRVCSFFLQNGLQGGFHAEGLKKMQSIEGHVE